MLEWLSDIPVWDSRQIESVASTAGNAVEDMPTPEMTSLFTAILVKSHVFKRLCTSILKDKIVKISPLEHFSVNLEKYIANNPFMARFSFEWDLTGFLSREYGNKNQTLGEVITITGTSNHTQAVTCSAYVSQVWPCVGPEILWAIQDAFRRRVDGQGDPETCGKYLSIAGLD